jgi:hypothetical protein
LTRKGAVDVVLTSNGMMKPVLDEILARQKHADFDQKVPSFWGNQPKEVGYFPILACFKVP